MSKISFSPENAAKKHGSGFSPWNVVFWPLTRFLLRVFFFAILIFFPFLMGQTDAAPAKVYLLKVEDLVIGPVTLEYVSAGLDRAERDQAQCVIIQLDTPGGLLSTTRSLVKRIMAAAVPVVVYVAPTGARAGSAGVFISYAAHVAAMAPSTNIGAAHPVDLTPQPSRERSFWDALKDMISAQKSPGESKSSAPPDAADPMNDKILNDTLAFIRAMAKERGRNMEWAQLSVSQSASITENEALEKNVIELIAKDVPDLLRQLDGRKVKVGNQEGILTTKEAILEEIPLSARQKFLNVWVNPQIAYFFLILGFYGLLYELTHPGFGAPGILGALFLIFALYSMQMLPTNYAGLALIVLALILFVLEAKVSGLGFFAVGGVAAMLLGSLILFDGISTREQLPVALVLAATLTTAGITVFLVRLVVRSQYRRSVSGQEGLLGEEGSAAVDFSERNEGKVFVHGELWNAYASHQIKKNDLIVVEHVQGMRLKVKKVAEKGV